MHLQRFVSDITDDDRLELLELQPKARVWGDVRYEALEMHQGATIDGELRPLKADEKPAIKLAASNAG